MPFWTKTRVGPRNHVLDRCADLQREGEFRDCPGHSKALTIFGAAVAAASLPGYKRDHSIANNVMQQKGSFSMPGKLKQLNPENFGRRRCGFYWQGKECWECTARAKSDIYDCLVHCRNKTLSLSLKNNLRTAICRQRIRGAWKDMNMQDIIGTWQCCHKIGDEKCTVVLSVPPSGTFN